MPHLAYMQDSVERLRSLVDALVPCGTHCVVVETKDHLKKVEDRDIPAMILGACDTSMQYRVLVVGADGKARVQVHRHVIIQPAAMRAALQQDALPRVAVYESLTGMHERVFESDVQCMDAVHVTCTAPLPLVAPVPSTPYGGEDVIWSAHYGLESASDAGARYMTNASANAPSRTPPKARNSAVVEAAAAATVSGAVRAVAASSPTKTVRPAAQADVRPAGPNSNMSAGAGPSCPSPKRRMVTWSDDWSVCKRQPPAARAAQVAAADDNTVSEDTNDLNEAMGMKTDFADSDDLLHVPPPAEVHSLAAVAALAVVEAPLAAAVVAAPA